MKVVNLKICGELSQYVWHNGALLRLSEYQELLRKVWYSKEAMDALKRVLGLHPYVSTALRRAGAVGNVVDRQ